MMRCVVPVLASMCVATALLAQDKSEAGPTNEKAQKTYNEGLEYLHKRMTESAVESFKKADKQDGGHCIACQQKMVKYGLQLADWKTAELASQEMVAEAQGNKDLALAHYQYGFVLLQEGIYRHKDELFSHAHDEMSAALAAYANFSGAVFADGRALAYMKQDDAARQRFEQFIKMTTEDNPDRQRAQRYISQPELARARMAPAFAVTTTDGQRISLDDLKGKVVLIDFWATWCAPCREALPRIKSIAKKFQDEPLIVLSVSLDDDEQKWKDFIAKNEMTWPQYRDAGFNGSMAKLFSVDAIPHTFTVDADGVLQDEHIGDAEIEGKLKKLVQRAKEVQSAAKPN